MQSLSSLARCSMKCPNRIPFVAKLAVREEFDLVDVNGSTKSRNVDCMSTVDDDKGLGPTVRSQIEISDIVNASIGAREKKIPAKEDSSEKEKSLDLFLKIGLDERTDRNTIANNKVTTNLTAVIHEVGVTDGCRRSVGNLIYTVATKYPGNALPHRPTLLQYVVSSKVKTTIQLDAALSFLATTGNENLDLNKFEEACGVGVEDSTEDIKHAFNGVFEENKASILELRYRTNDLPAKFTAELPVENITHEGFSWGH
ncbi:glutamine--tRNA ligase-like [Vicia villosa]|uniref:glutamine--tRNA ligase-like n=1 Tax=Vicia villosa TaxID=3911 RepID=UPI00273CAC5F|nr:glutamine--tRNA ligase-like [Vicia villosa]XP_058760627.1 glutamine--tRNA ligase-like [Vicia villosa]